VPGEAFVKTNASPENAQAHKQQTSVIGGYEFAHDWKAMVRHFFTSSCKRFS
jgi:hypothetical protein